MSEETGDAPRAVCPRCGAVLTPTTVRTSIWHGDRVAIVEDIPAHVCSACMEQFYDDEVSDALRRLAEEGFPSGESDTGDPGAGVFAGGTCRETNHSAGRHLC